MSDDTDENSSSSSSDDDSMPGLVLRQVAVPQRAAAAAPAGNHPGAAAAADNHQGAAAAAAADNHQVAFVVADAGVVAGAESDDGGSSGDDDGDDSLPPLRPRLHNFESFSSSSSSSSDDDDDDDGDGDNSIPELIGRDHPAYGSSSSGGDDDDSIPALVGRGHRADESSSSSDDDNGSVPPLLPGGYDTESSSSNHSTGSSMPELIPRRDGAGANNGSSDDDDDDDDDVLRIARAREAGRAFYHRMEEERRRGGRLPPNTSTRPPQRITSPFHFPPNPSNPLAAPFRFGAGSRAPGLPLEPPGFRSANPPRPRPPEGGGAQFDIGSSMFEAFVRDQQNDGDQLSQMMASLLGMGVDLFGGGGGGYGTDREDGWSDGEARDDASLDGFLRAEHTVTVIEQDEDDEGERKDGDDDEEEEEEDKKPAAAAVGQVLPRVEGEPEKYDDETRTFENNESLGLYSPFQSMFRSSGPSHGVQQRAGPAPAARHVDRPYSPGEMLVDLLMGPTRNLNRNLDDDFVDFDVPPLIERNSNNNNNNSGGSDTDPEMPELLGFSANNNNHHHHQVRGPRGVRGRTRYPDDAATERLRREGHENRRRRSQQIREARSREQAEARRRRAVQQLEERERSRLRDEEILVQNRRLRLSSTNDNAPDIPQSSRLTDTDTNHEYAERFERAQRAVAEIERQRAERGEGEMGAYVTIEAYRYGSESSSDDDDDDDDDGNESDSTADSMPPLILCQNGEDATADNDNNAEGEAVD